MEIPKFTHRNLAGLDMIFYAFLEDVEEIPFSGTNLIEEVIFKTDKGWSQIYFTDKTGDFEYVVNENDDGDTHSIKVNCVHPNLFNVIDARIAEIRRKPFIMAMRDNGGRQIICGTPEVQPSFSYRFRSGESLKQRKGYDFSFVYQSMEPLLFINKIVAIETPVLINGTIFTLQNGTFYNSQFGANLLMQSP